MLLSSRSKDLEPLANSWFEVSKVESCRSKKSGPIRKYRATRFWLTDNGRINSSDSAVRRCCHPGMAASRQLVPASTTRGCSTAFLSDRRGDVPTGRSRHLCLPAGSEGCHGYGRSRPSWHCHKQSGSDPAAYHPLPESLSASAAGMTTAKRGTC